MPGRPLVAGREQYPPRMAGARKNVANKYTRKWAGSSYSPFQPLQPLHFKDIMDGGGLIVNNFYFGDSETGRPLDTTMRAIWKGSISFGLVNIPIALYPATR